MALQKKTTVRDIYANRTTKKKQDANSEAPAAKQVIQTPLTKNAGTISARVSLPSAAKPNPALAQAVVQSIGSPSASSRSDSSGKAPAAKSLRMMRTKGDASAPESKSSAPSISIRSGAASAPSLSAAMKRGQTDEDDMTVIERYRPTTLERIALSARSGVKDWASSYMDYAAVGTSAENTAGKDITSAQLENLRRQAANEQAVIDSYERGEGVYDKADADISREQLANLQFYIDAYSKASGEQDNISKKTAAESAKVRGSAAEDMERATHGLGTVGQTLVRGVGSTTQNLLDLAAGGGVSALPSIGMRVYGQSAQEAIERGDSREKAVQIGLARAAAELIPEGLSGGNPLTSVGGGRNTRLRQALDAITSSKYVNNFVTQLGVGAFGEGAEEVITQGLNDVISAIAYGDEADLSSPKEYAEAFWGGVVGGLYGNIVNPTNLAKNAQQDVDDIARNSAQRAERAAAAQAEQASIDKAAQNAAQGAAGAGGITTGAQAAQSESGALNAPQSVQVEQAGQSPRQTTLGIYQNRATRQQNIDNAGQSAYTDISDNTVSGGAEGDTGAGAGAGGGLAENRDGVSDVYDKRDSNYQGQGRLGGLSVDSGFVLSEQAKSTIQSRGVAFVETRDVSADSAAFSSALDEARAANAKNGWAVSPKSAQDISETGVRVYMDENGSAGFGVAPDGDIEAVFANKSKGAPPHAAESLIPQAIAAGGSKLDCYGSGLVTLYSQYGFVPVARVVFDPEYANEGWDAGKGTPDIYFMMATDTDADSVVANGGSYPVPTQAELDALPSMDYESAYAYRDSLLAQQEAAQAAAVNSESQGVESLEQLAAEYTERYNRAREIEQSGGDISQEEKTWLSGTLQRLLDMQQVRRSDRLALIGEERARNGETSKGRNTEANHIDNRTEKDMTSQQTKAFSFDHPELHPYFVEAAKVLREDVGEALSSDYTKKTQNGGYYLHAGKPTLSDGLDGISRPDIIKACDNLIEDNGQENYAVAKRVERRLDDMLTNGYYYKGEFVQPDSAYIEAKGRIVGGHTESELRAKQDAEADDFMRALGYGDGGLYGRSVGAATPRRGEQVASRNNLQYDANLSEEGRSAVADAGLTHERISDSLANARAEANIIRDGDGNWLNLRDCMDDLQATIESGGVLSPEQVKLAEKVMTELDHMARDSGDRSVFNEFNRVVVQASKTDSAQSLRAWRSFSDGYLGTVDQASRVLETLQENPQTNHNQKRTAKEADEILRRVSNEVGEAADSALEKAASEDTPRRRRRRQSDDEDAPRRQYSPKAKAERDEVLDYLTAQKKRRERAAARAGASDATVDSDQFGLDDFFEMPEIDRMEIPKLRELIKQSWQDKQAVYENLMDYFVERYGMSEQEAGLAANNISTLFYGELAELSSSALHRAFDKKKRGQTDTAWIDKAVEYINMGALTDPEFRDIASEKLFGHRASDEVLNRVSQYAEDAQEMRDAGDIDGLREQVFAISTERGYKPDASIRRILDQRTDVNEMYNLAQSLAVGLAVDQAKPTFGKRLATWQYLSHLYNTQTIIRNVVANSVFAPIDRLSNTLAIGPDFVAAMIRSASEGGTVAQNRTVARQPWGLNRDVSETRRAYVEDALVDNALDINRGAAQGKYTAQNQRLTNRTFNPKGNAWERFNNFREGVLGLGLNVTDAVQKGTTKGQSEAAMRSLMNRGGVMTEEAAQAITESDMLYRSFQRETPLGSFLSIAREGANVVGIGKTQGRNIKTHEFGLGSLVDTYTQVPGALVHTAADYTPLGIVNTALEIYNAIQFNRGQTDAMADPGPLSQQYKGLTNADASVVAQHNAALSIGRMMTGGAIFGLFSYLAAAGAAAVRLYGDDDRDEDETLAAQGVSGFQFNQDAFIRSLLGRDTTWRNGDVIHDLSQYPPVSTIAEIAVICRDEDDDNKFIRILDATARGLIEQFGDLSMVSAAKTVYDDIQYRGDKNAWEVAGDIAGDLIGNSVSGMVPGFVRQIAKATDPVMRDTSSDTVLGRAWNRFRSAVPGLRQTLPAKVDYKGEERQYAGNTLTRLLNTFVLPGDVTIYRQDEVVDYITQLSDSTGTSLYADAYAPKKVVYDGESYELNTDARRMYNETYKSAYYDAMEAFMKSDYAKTMPDDMAAEVASGLRALAAYQARREYFKLRGMSYTPENDTYARYDSIGDPALYMSMRAAMKQLSESDGKDNEAFKAVYAQWRTLPPKGRAMYTDGVEGQFDGISTLKKLDNCLQAGMSTQQFYEAKAEYRALSDNDSLGATARRAAFAHWLDTESGFTTSARMAALENFSFTTTIVADEGKYEQMASSGVGNAASERIFNSIQQLQPESGNKTVSDLQRYEAITASGASESEQLAALRVYASDSQIEYFQAAFDNGIALGKWTAVLRSVRESETGNMSQGNLVRAMYENGIPKDKARAMYNVYKAKHNWRSSYEQAYANAW